MGFEPELSFQGSEPRGHGKWNFSGCDPRRGKMAANVSVTPGRWIGLGWSVFKEDVGNFILVALIGLALMSFSAFVVTGPVLAGFCLVVRRRMLEGRIDLNDLFAGFSQFVDALLISLLTAIFM